MKLRDAFWLWGHPEGCYNHDWGNDNESRMTPMEACLYLGVRNTFMVPRVIDREVSIRQYNKSFRTLRTVAWECRDAGRDPSVIERYIAEAKDFPNFRAMVFDDFQNGGEYRKFPPENLWRVRERMHENEVRPMDMWMVLYTHEIGLDAAKDTDFLTYIAPFDGVILWTWKEKDVCLIPEKYEVFRRMTEGKRRMFGCYLYNFGERCQATPEKVRWQLDWYREKLYAGEAEGVVLHTNTMCDLDYPAYDAACEWMERHGDEAFL